MAATNQYYKTLDQQRRFSWNSEAILAQYEEETKERNLEGYVITLQFPSLLPFLLMQKIVVEKGIGNCKRKKIF